jgi:uncharacterized tellurite resistance protein B-like protein
MFADFLRRLTAPSPAPLPDADARIALCALLVRVAKADARYTVEEIRRIDRILATRYGLDPVQAARLRGQAEDLEHQAPDTVRFTRAIKDAVPYEERLAVIEALWDVVLADGEREDHEMALLRLVAPMLGISDQDSAEARRRVDRARSLNPD